jgi:hypothetical protein
MSYHDARVIVQWPVRRLNVQLFYPKPYDYVPRIFEIGPSLIGRDFRLAGDQKARRCSVRVLEDF